MDVLSATLLFVFGIAAGWLNTVSGGGSMLTVPALMWVGLPADVANGTSRVAIFAHGIAATWGFHGAGSLDRRLLLKVSPPIVIGAVAGAFAATVIAPATFKPLLIGTFLLMAVTLFLRPHTFAPQEGTPPVEIYRSPLALAALTLAGFYGGFLQAGVGLVMLAIFSAVLRIDLLRANALKVTAVLVYTSLVLLVFASRERIAWPPGLALAAGHVVGALLGVRFAVTQGQEALKKVVFATIVVSCVSLLWK
jgi:uncharacterized membrane protein YfcA